MLIIRKTEIYLKKQDFVQQMSQEILKRLTLKDDSLTHFESERKNCVCLISFVGEEKNKL